MGNPMVHVELYTNDIAASKKFFSALLDWKLTDMQPAPGMNYTGIDAGAPAGGGMMQNPVPNSPGQWTPYADVDDVDAMLKKAEGLGAKIVTPKTDVMGMGWFGIVSDPTGVMFGFWQTKR